MVRGEHAVVALGPSPALTIVDRIRAGHDVAAAVEEVRAVLRGDGRTAATWQIGPLSEPADLAEQLLALGLVPNEAPPFEPHGTALALVRPPAIEPAPGIVARRADDRFAAYRLLGQTNGMPEAALDGLARSFVDGHDDRTMSVYVVEVDGTPAAVGTAALAESGIWLTGAGTLPEARGRGAYRALIAA